MNALSDKDSKIPLPKFIQLFTSNGVSVPKAMAVAGKVYPKHNTPAKLSQLSDATLAALGVEDKDIRRLVLSSLQKAGHISKGISRKALKTTFAAEVSLPAAPIETASAGSSYIQTVTSPRKRRRLVDSNEFLSDEPIEEMESGSGFHFNEIVDEEVLRTKSVVINRAPVMMAWATLVAERLHFSREEALSIASVYTEMNAISKSASLGIYRQDRDRGSDAEVGGSQPYVKLMGRRPLYRANTGKWCALSNGKPVPPTDAFSYISRSFRQTTPYIIGALKLLTHSYSPEELNTKAWSLYAEFRPQANEWGKRSQIHCQTIMELSKKMQDSTKVKSPIAKETSPNVQNNLSVREDTCTDGEPRSKKTRHLTVEEYEAILDQDNTFNNVDLDCVTVSVCTNQAHA
ncbi:hypothetical protein HYPSUDRAFT_175504 [Hypholoma sublateritium FD-334 SS-4]|uniref:Uncharacterized protein n=1 Tax=Hypholoma sublateritium (strain FD-334 SS-4) TaxID=945553 RepID=A0A0D2PQ26_HYPSF|nr:hypothetical protein HYPSUDRAFT_175504 [Hypholoma sublateritium FD-334 SS-4]